MPPQRSATAAAAGPLTLQTALSKLREGSDAEWSKDEVFELLHWLRQAMGLAGGLLWGYLDLPGLLGFLGFLAINVGAVWWFVGNVLGIHSEEWGENTSTELMQEGMPLSMSAFMVTWVLAYNVFHV